jgi:hypothetical protein
MVDRRFETLDVLPPPSDEEFVSKMGPIPSEVLARSSWSEECPVTLDERVYLTVATSGSTAVSTPGR